MTRFHDLCTLQYEKRPTRMEQAEFDLLSAQITHEDRASKGLLVGEAYAASVRRITSLQLRYEDLQQEAL